MAIPTGRMIVGRSKTTYFIGEKEVTKEEFDARFPAKKVIGLPLAANMPMCWPMKSEALAVHPSQVAEATEAARAAGVPTEFLPDGRAVLRDRAHRKAFVAYNKAFDKSGGYGD